MDWQQKAAALNALARLEICIRSPGDWYVHHGVEIGGNGALSGIYGNGVSPEEAINDHWRRLVTELEPHLFLVTDAMGDRRKQRRWNGFMWEDVK